MRAAEGASDSRLRRLAKDKIVAETGKALDVIGEAAAAMLADLYAAGSVTGLPGACWDVSRARARGQQTVVDKPFRERPWRGPASVLVLVVAVMA